MSLSDRVKEARINKKITQQQVAEFLGVAKSTISAYENGDRDPPPNVIYKLIQILDVDANFLFQDEMRKVRQAGKDVLSPEESEHIKKFRHLDGHGKKIVTIVTDEEYARCTEDESSKVVELTLDRGSGQLVARNGRDLSQDDKEEILNITRRWREKHPQQN